MKKRSFDCLGSRSWIEIHFQSCFFYNWKVIPWIASSKSSDQKYRHLNHLKISQLLNSQYLCTFLSTFMIEKNVSFFFSLDAWKWLISNCYFPNTISKIRSLCFERKAQVSFRRSYFPPQIQGENTNYKIRVATSGHSITTRTRKGG